MSGCGRCTVADYLAYLTVQYCCTVVPLVLYSLSCLLFCNSHSLSSWSCDFSTCVCVMFSLVNLIMFRSVLFSHWFIVMSCDPYCNYYGKCDQTLKHSLFFFFFFFELTHRMIKFCSFSVNPFQTVSSEHRSSKSHHPTGVWSNCSTESQSNVWDVKRWMLSWQWLNMLDCWVDTEWGQFQLLLGIQSVG